MLNNPAARKLASGIIEPPARLLLRLHVSPDFVTVFGTIGAVASALICFPSGNFGLGVLLIAIFAISDLLDGTMARMAGTSGPWGNFLDATLDRVADGTACAGTLALVMGQVTSYAKARAEAVGATANVGIAERAERLIAVLIAALLTSLGVPYVLPAVLWALGALGLVTIIQRMAVVRGQLKP